MKFVGERRALASSIMVFYAVLYAGAALSGMFPPEWTTPFLAMAGCYGVAFFGLAAGYFWARWFAIGVALSGVISGVVSLWQVGPENILLFFGGTHLAAVLLLWGQTMAGPFDGQPAWRARFHIDDHASQRLGRAVIRAGVSLPYILLYALAPKPGGAALALGAAVLATGGTWGLVKLRTWGLFALAGAAGLAAFAATGPSVAVSSLGGTTDLNAFAAVAAIGLAAAVAPFVKPMITAGRAR